MLEYRIIPTRTAGKEAFWKCEQTDGQTEWQIHSFKVAILT